MFKATTEIFESRFQPRFLHESELTKGRRVLQPAGTINFSILAREILNFSPIFKGTNFAFEKILPPVQVQSALLISYQGEPSNKKQRFVGSVLGQMLSMYCFEVLRTQEQLGKFKIDFNVNLCKICLIFQDILQDAMLPLPILTVLSVLLLEDRTTPNMWSRGSKI